jgi:hypothetical protein
MKYLFRVGSLGNAPRLLESLNVEEPQSGQTLRNGARRQFSLLEQLGLIFANMFRAQTIGRTPESPREIFNSADVTACCIFRVITTLEFLQHHFA